VRSAETRIIFFRIAQGAFAALLFPAALAIVVGAFPQRERGRALAVFFGVTGALTSVGPLAGGYLTEWTWRAIFWINVPVAIIALVLTAKGQAGRQERQRMRIDYRGAVLISAAMGLIVLGLQQAATWGWTDARTVGSIVAGALLLAGFVALELRRTEPLIPKRIFARRGFAADNLVLGLMSAVFVPFFFFASVYAQASLGYSATKAGLVLLAFFAGFAPAAQWGGRIVDKRGARPAVILGCLVAAVGFYLWGTELPGREFSAQSLYLVLSGAGLGLVLGPVSTDALNRAPEAGYGTVTGITQTVRNFGASLGLAIMGSIFIGQNVTRVEPTLGAHGVPAPAADQIAHSVTSAGGGGAAGAPRAIVEAVQLDIAHSSQTVAFIMAGVMAAALLVAAVALPAGRVEEPAAQAEMAAA
jgi:MFS family permease